MTDPPADILRRLRPIPTTVGPPQTRPCDVVGVDPDGAPCRIEVVDATAPVLLLFLAADCIGCRDLWAGLAEVHAGLGGAARLAVVTKGARDEDPAVIRALAKDAPALGGVSVVMSSDAYRHYHAAAPFMVVAAPDEVRVEGVAWGVDETVRTTIAALPPV